MKYLILFVLVIVSPVLAEDDSSYLCKTIQHVQVLRSVTTSLDGFEFELVVKAEKVQLTDRFFYGASELTMIAKEGKEDWVAEDKINRLKKQARYLYVSRLDGVGVKTISASCEEKPKF